MKGFTSTQYPGSIGTASFFPQMGLFATSLSSASTVDSGLLLDIQAAEKTQIDAFTASANSYNGLKGTYE